MYKRQATSSLIAETIATYELGAELVYERKMLADLGSPERGPSLLWQDATASIATAYNDANHSAKKHIDIKYLWKRDMVLKGELIVRHIPRNINFTDSGTKAGTKAEFSAFKPFLTGEKSCPELFGYSQSEKVTRLGPYRVNAPEEVDSSLKFLLEPTRHNINYVSKITDN